MTSLDVRAARRWFYLALGKLAAARTNLDALNVFPVPDGDTGSNVVRTMTSGARAAQSVTDEAGLSVLANAFAEGALWGARGNSGIIVAQWFQAVAASLEGLAHATPNDLIRAFDAVATASRAAVAEPVRGTMITVSEAVAAAVLDLPDSCSLADVTHAALHAAYDATNRTTDQLPVLRGTGRVDAGAVCLVLIIEALATTIGVPITPHHEWFAGLTELETTDEGGFEVMYLLRASEREASRLRSHLGTVGDSVIVTHGADDLWHVHVHLPEPRLALAETKMSQVCVRRLETSSRGVGIVSATSAPGLLQPLAEFGDVAVLNASARTIVRAITEARTREVLVLPCSATSQKEALKAARDPAVITEDIRVHIAPTTHDLEVLEAASTFAVPTLTVEAALAASTEASRTVTFDVATLPTDPSGPLASLAHDVVAHDPELVTILTGSDPSAPSAARQLAAMIRAALPDVETHTIYGGQSAPALAVSAI